MAMSMRKSSSSRPKPATRSASCFTRSCEAATSLTFRTTPARAFPSPSPRGAAPSATSTMTAISTSSSIPSMILPSFSAAIHAPATIGSKAKPAGQNPVVGASGQASSASRIFPARRVCIHKLTKSAAAAAIFPRTISASTSASAKPNPSSSSKSAGLAASSKPSKTSSPIKSSSSKRAKASSAPCNSIRPNPPSLQNKSSCPCRGAAVLRPLFGFPPATLDSVSVIPSEARTASSPRGSCAEHASGTSRLGYAESSDGTHFTRRPEPVLSPETDYEKDGGVEDPRLQKLDDTFYLTYTGYNKKDAQLCLATSRDLIHWERKGVILPAYKGNWNKGWTKSGAIVPEKINGKYWMYWLGTAADKTDQMGLSSSTDLIHWTDATQTPALPRPPSMFDSRGVAPGPPPLLPPQGIVPTYHGAAHNLS